MITSAVFNGYTSLPNPPIAIPLARCRNRRIINSIAYKCYLIIQFFCFSITQLHLICLLATNLSTLFYYLILMLLVEVMRSLSQKHHNVQYSNFNEAEIVSLRLLF
jgi:hypothetical protein